VRAAALYLVVATGIALAVIEAAAYVALHRQDFPWTELDLDEPIGRATAAKLAGLHGEPGRCRALITQAGLADQPAPPVHAGPNCGYADGMRLLPESAEAMRFAPAEPVTSCPMAAALALWEREVVAPAAVRHFGRPVARILHAGSYSCRRLYGRTEGEYSEHATANAFDILGFELADGGNVSVQRDWLRDDARAAFLRDVRDGACGLFATVLSPDYNAAHADHLHLDQARRGAGGWRMCR
jgi:hypothetical protein